VSPKVADPAMRTALIENAARLVAEEGHDALTIRRLAGEVGASTMVVYTHFGGMEELRAELRREAFTRLGEHLGGVDETDDPVADLIVMGWAYHANAMTNPHLYRIMFMDRPIHCADGESRIDASTFAMLLNGVARCIDAGRFRPAEPLDLAQQIWALSHGVASLVLAGIFSDEAAMACLNGSATNLLIGFGDEPERLLASAERVLPRMPGGDLGLGRGLGPDLG
jgi:AcrR family transcriptional regulator